MSWVLATMAGALGAVARYGTASWLQRKLETARPVGTAAVNLTGALVLGFLVGWGGLSEPGFRVIAGGFLGGYTTFSTWMVETVLLGAEGGRIAVAEGAVNVFGLAVAGIAVAAAGYGVGSLL